MLEGRAVLVVESEFLIALDMQRILEQAGSGRVAVVRGRGDASQAPAGTPGLEAPELVIVSLSHSGDIDGLTLAGGFRAAGLPLVVTTPDPAQAAGIPGLAGVPCVLKPFIDAELLAACTVAIATAAR